MSSSNTSSPAHLLAIFVKEPIEGKVKPTLSKEASAREALLAYQTLVTALLHQLEGLKDTQVVCYISPHDAVDAVKFWLLPLMRGKVTMLNETEFSFAPSRAAPTIYFHFKASRQAPNEELFQEIRQGGFDDGFQTVSIMGTNCPDCGSRWIHMAQMLATSQQARVLGECSKHGVYLSTETNDCNSIQSLPQLPKIKQKKDWESILSSPIGGKLSRIRKEQN